MAATVVRLRTRADQIDAEKAEQLRQMVLAFPGLPDRLSGEMLAFIDRQTAATASPWVFVMISPQQNRAVVKWLKANSRRPLVAVELWAELFTDMNRDTGEIRQNREQLAAAVGASPQHVSEIMTELEGIGAIIRRREKVAGMRGPGMVRYFMSPRVGTHLPTSAARDKAQAAAPQLRLID